MDVHGPMMKCLQKFKGGKDDSVLRMVHGQPSPGTVKEMIEGYIPEVPNFWEMEIIHSKRKILILMPRGHLKALDISTPIPTPDGFKAMADIQVGDKVFGADGRIYPVTDVSEIRYSEDVYDVEFSTGETITCDGGHLWLTSTRKDRENKRRDVPSVKTTSEIASTVLVRKERNHRIPVAMPLDTNQADVPLEPYVLGAWLGDGTSETGTITIGNQDAAEMVALLSQHVPIAQTSVMYRYRLSDGDRSTAKAKSTTSTLRKLGVLGNKHIPDVYMRASLEQRLALLQGLMDTDGTISKEGQCFFTNMRCRLTEQVRELVGSLGLKCSSVYRWPAKLHGRELATCYTVSFYTYPELPVFRLTRKAERIKPCRKVSLQKYRQIVSVKPSEPAFVKCISIDSPDHLYLAGDGFIPTHNSTVMMAHYIQWILNYPDIRILLSSGTGSQVAGFLKEIKGHFQYNEMFRWLYPEFCPPDKSAKEFGNQEQFTVPNCRRPNAKEPTVGTVSVGAVVASTHYDVVGNDDVVDKENVRTPEQILSVKSHLGMLWPLVETAPDSDKRQVNYQRGWWYLIGTCYDFSDAYATVQDEEAKKPESEKSYHIYKQSAILEGDLSNLATCKTLWPSRLPASGLKAIADDPLQGYGILSSQYLMNPIPDKAGLVESPDQIVWVPPDVIKKLYAYFSLHVTVDLAGMEPSTNKMADNDYTVINLHGFGTDGTLFILSVLRWRYTPFDVIDILFKLSSLHPRLMDIKIEKEAHARVLLPFLKREMAKRNKYLPLVEIHRDNRTSKQQRIKGLQPWFRNGSIKFADNQPHKLAIINEIMRFPKYAHDDILDTIADAMQNRDGGVNSDVLPTGRKGIDMIDVNQKMKLPDGSYSVTNFSPDLQNLLDRIWGQQPDEEHSMVDSLTGW